MSTYYCACPEKGEHTSQTWRSNFILGLHKQKFWISVLTFSYTPQQVANTFLFHLSKECCWRSAYPPHWQWQKRMVFEGQLKYCCPGLADPWQHSHSLHQKGWKKQIGVWLLATLRLGMAVVQGPGARVYDRLLNWLSRRSWRLPATQRSQECKSQ